MLRILSAVALLALGSNSAAAQERATTREAEQLVRTAVKFLQKEGPAKAFAAFNDPAGSFTYRDLYIFVYDVEGLVLAHGSRKDLVGKNVIGLKDADGKLFIQEGIGIARAHGRGWSEYRWANPVTKQVEQKVSYLEHLEGLVVGCGAYRK